MVEFNATLIIAMFSFVVFIMIMNAIFYNPILKIMKKRDEYITSNYDEAKNYNEKADEYTKQYDSKIKETQNSCRINIRNIVEEAHKEANIKTQTAREQAKTDIQSRKNELSKDEETLKDIVKNTVVKDIASTIETKLLGSKITVQDIK